MKYESEFRIKEKEFYPREKYSHKKVIDELANIVKRADLEIEEAEEANYKALVMLDRTEKELKKSQDEIRHYQEISAISILGLVIVFIWLL